MLAFTLLAFTIAYSIWLQHEQAADANARISHVQGQVAQNARAADANASALAKANSMLARHGQSTVPAPSVSIVTGPPGATGPQGPEGAAGAQGANGSNGSSGPAGAVGPRGPRGDKGENGSPGPSGTAGAAGPSGDVGATGPAGAPGSSGAAGKDGKDGATGPVGPAGIDGQPPTSWTFTYLLITYQCDRTTPFDPKTPTYTCEVKP